METVLETVKIMILLVALAIVTVILFTMIGKMMNFFGKTNYPKSSLLQAKSKYSTASNDISDKAHTFFRNCDKATTEPITGDITGNQIFIRCKTVFVIILQMFCAESTD